jgi:chromosome segregation ATPase
VIHNQNLKKELEEKNIEQANLIKEMQDHINQLTQSNKNLENSNYDLKDELKFLKESYDDLLKENNEYRNSSETKDKTIKNLDTELKEMKNVIEKLTEIRVILNKYFSSHFENFTPQERKIIQQVGVQDNNVHDKHVSFNEMQLKDKTNIKPAK